MKKKYLAIFLVFLFPLSLVFGFRFAAISGNRLTIVEFSSGKLRTLASVTLPFNVKDGVIVSDKVYLVSDKVYEYNLDGNFLARTVNVAGEGILWDSEVLITWGGRTVFLIDPSTLNLERLSFSAVVNDVILIGEQLLVSYGKFVELFSKKDKTTVWKIEARNEIFSITYNPVKKAFAAITENRNFFIVSLERERVPRVVYSIDLEERGKLCWYGDILILYSERDVSFYNTEDVRAPRRVSRRSFPSPITSAVFAEGNFFLGSSNRLYVVSPSLKVDEYNLAAQRIVMMHAPEEERVLSPGTIVWSTSLGSEVRGVPASTGNDVLVVDTDGNVHSVSLAGKKNWVFKTGFIVTSSPVFHNGVVYVAGWDDFVYAISVDGKLMWKTRLDSDLSRPFSVSPYGIHVASDNGYLHLLDFSGKVLWSYKNDEWISTKVVTDSLGNTYFGTSQNSVYSIFARGTLRWKATLDSWPVVGPALTRDSLFVGTLSGRVYRINRNTGEVVWRKDLPVTKDGSLAIYRDFLVVGCVDGIYIVVVGTGDSWRIFSALNPASVTVSEEGYVYFFSGNELYSIDLLGNLRWKVTVGESLAPILIVENGIVVVNKRGELFLVYDGTSGPAKEWGMIQRDAQNTGNLR